MIVYCTNGVSFIMILLCYPHTLHAQYVLVGTGWDDDCYQYT